MHHEYAVLAEFERTGDYTFSKQLTRYLELSTVLRLVISPTPHATPNPYRIQNRKTKEKIEIRCLDSGCSEIEVLHIEPRGSANVIIERMASGAFVQMIEDIFSPRPFRREIMEELPSSGGTWGWHYWTATETVIDHWDRTWTLIIFAPFIDVAIAPFYGPVVAVQRGVYATDKRLIRKATFSTKNKVRKVTNRRFERLMDAILSLGDQ